MWYYVVDKKLKNVHLLSRKVAFLPIKAAFLYGLGDKRQVRV